MESVLRRNVLIERRARTTQKLATVVMASPFHLWLGGKMRSGERDRARTIIPEEIVELGESKWAQRQVPAVCTDSTSSSGLGG